MYPYANSSPNNCNITKTTCAKYRAFETNKQPRCGDVDTQQNWLLLHTELVVLACTQPTIVDQGIERYSVSLSSQYTHTRQTSNLPHLVHIRFKWKWNIHICLNPSTLQLHDLVLSHLCIIRASTHYTGYVCTLDMINNELNTWLARDPLLSSLPPGSSRWTPSP